MFFLSKVVLRLPGWALSSGLNEGTSRIDEDVVTAGSGFIALNGGGHESHDAGVVKKCHHRSARAAVPFAWLAFTVEFLSVPGPTTPSSLIASSSTMRDALSCPITAHQKAWLPGAKIVPVIPVALAVTCRASTVCCSLGWKNTIPA